MDASDPRHGTDRGHNAHVRSGIPPCAACKRAHNRMNHLRLLHPEIYGRVPAIGSRRRIQALQALGYGRDRISRELGYNDGGSIAYLMTPKAETVTRAVERKIVAVYDRLAMLPPPTGAGAQRARTWAKRFGYAPPLAWDDIDTDPAPTGVRESDELTRRRVTRADLDQHACPRCGVMRQARTSDALCIDCRVVEEVAS